MPRGRRKEVTARPGGEGTPRAPSPHGEAALSRFLSPAAVPGKARPPLSQPRRARRAPRPARGAPGRAGLGTSPAPARRAPAAPEGLRRRRRAGSAREEQEQEVEEEEEKEEEDPRCYHTPGVVRNRARGPGARSPPSATTSPTMPSGAGGRSARMGRAEAGTVPGRSGAQRSRAQPSTAEPRRSAERRQRCRVAGGAAAAGVPVSAPVPSRGCATK